MEPRITHTVVGEVLVRKQFTKFTASMSNIKTNYHNNDNNNSTTSQEQQQQQEQEQQEREPISSRSTDNYP